MEVGGGGRPEGVGIAVVECTGEGGKIIEIVEADFFDQSLLVIAFGSQEDGRMTLT